MAKQADGIDAAYLEKLIAANRALNNKEILIKDFVEILGDMAQRNMNAIPENAVESLAQAWKALKNNGRTTLMKNTEALLSFLKLKSNAKIKALKINDDILAGIKSYSINENATSFVKICNDLDNALTNALPDVEKIKNLDKFMGGAGFGNASDFTRRHADLGLKKNIENADFFKNADEIVFEEMASYDGVANAVADIQIIKGGKKFVGEFKAGDNIISSNFSSQCINFLQRVDDLRDFKLFRRDAVNLSKESVINDCVSKGIIVDGKVLQLFNDYKTGILKIPGNIDKFNIKTFMESNDNWFDTIFNSNF